MVTSELPQEVEEIVARAHADAALVAGLAPGVRAKAIVAISDALEANSDLLTEIAMRETGLPETRLRTEIKRTAVQLRLFAEAASELNHLDARIDHADPDFVLGPRPDIRRTHIPLGPVINFSASNFPFAFSVLGGDSAAILAAGCPLIVKAHPGHPELSDATAKIVNETIARLGLPSGMFGLFHGQEEGVAVLKDPRIKAGAFTGSIAGGRFLADIAWSRPTPIPFYGELGSVNPVFMTAAAIEERAQELADGYLTSVSGSAGQLCTKPGFVFVPEGSGFADAVRASKVELPEQRLLGPRIAEGFAARLNTIRSSAGVEPVIEGSLRFDDEGHGFATATIVAVSLEAFRAGHEAIVHEAFGPMSIIVEVPAEQNLSALMPEFYEGNLSGTLHISKEEETGETDNAKALQELVQAMSKQVGRIVFNGWSTGVAVTPAQQHGGPWPATTTDTSTSVGVTAINRFLRPVAYQNTPQAFLPAVLRDDNPEGIPQSITPAGVSNDWGARWR